MVTRDAILNLIFPMTVLIWLGAAYNVIRNMRDLSRLRREGRIPQRSIAFQLDLLRGRYNHIPELRRNLRTHVVLLAAFVVAPLILVGLAVLVGSAK